MNSLSAAATFPEDATLAAAAEVAVRDVLKARPGEKALIITNPEREVLQIAAALYDALVAAKARPTMLIQGIKGQMDNAEEAVIAAFEAQPDIVMSISAGKIGKDAEGIRTPYDWDGVSYDHVFHYQLHGSRTLRAFWSPSISRAMFIKTVPIDYAQLQERCRSIKAILDRAVSVRVTNANGTDLHIGLLGRLAKSDNGDYSCEGSGGNLPAGEVFISPELGTARGSLVFDGSIAGTKDDILIAEPIRCTVEAGFVVKIEGGAEARELLAALETGAEGARRMAGKGELSAEKAEAYARNARSLGELGIGLNPAAEVVGNMLEDEKAFRTCHVAIGSNYDEDAPALIHLDGLVSRPTIAAVMKDGSQVIIERDGELLV